MFHPFGLIGDVTGLAVHHQAPFGMDQIVMAIDAFFFITRTGVNHRPVGQHGAALVGHVQQVAVAFLALVVVESGIGRFPGLLSVVFTLYEMNRHVFDAVVGFGKEKVKRNI
jgi:hypothetical protein